MLDERQEQLCSESRWDFSDLRAIFLNCTLKPSPELSHTEGLIRISRAIMEKNGVATDLVRPVDYSLQHLGYVIPPQADAGCRFDHPNPLYR